MVTLADALRYSALGWSVIPMKMATKLPAVRWKRFQTLRPDEEQLRKWFDHGHVSGLAVIFGDVSGGLASRDFDDLEAYQAWADDHPELAKTLPTVETRRGRHVYCRFAADDVAAFRRLIGKPDGIGAIHCDGGELRIGVGCYSVIPNSQHPSGFVYRWLVSPFDRPIPLLTIQVSGFISLPPCNRDTECHERATVEDSLGTSQEGVLEPECLPLRKQNPECASLTVQQRGKNGKWSSARPATIATATALSAELAGITDPIERAILSTVPKQRGHRNRLVFSLCGALKAIPWLTGATFEQLQPFVRRWHNLAKPFIGTLAFEETWADFVHAWPRRKLAKGNEPMAEFLAKAFAADPPECVRHYESEPIKQLASLCRELQRASGNEPFYLSARTAGRYFGVNASSICRWLGFLRDDGVIEQVKKGDARTMLASRFRYVGGATRRRKRILGCKRPASPGHPNETAEPKQPSVFTPLTTGVLRDNAKLFDWWQLAAQQKNPVVTDSQADLLNVFAAAERALEVGDNPVALFAFIVTGKRWKVITDSQEGRALYRLRRLRNPQRERERRRPRDDGDEPRSEPVSAGDILHEFLSKTGFQK